MNILKRVVANGSSYTIRESGQGSIYIYADGSCIAGPMKLDQAYEGFNQLTNAKAEGKSDLG
jgi:hypothetical protein